MRINRVAKAKKAAGECVRCGAKILKGQPYKWIKGRYTAKRVYCGEHSPLRSEMTGSDKLSQLYAAQETVEDLLASKDGWEPSDLVEALNDAAQIARDVGQEYRDAVDNMPENFQQGSKADELNDSADQCDSWADALEGAASDIENYDWPAKDTEGKLIDPKEKNETDADQTNEEVDEHLREEARDAAEQAIGELEL